MEDLIIDNTCAVFSIPWLEPQALKMSRVLCINWSRNSRFVYQLHFNVNELICGIPSNFYIYAFIKYLYTVGNKLLGKGSLNNNNRLVQSGNILHVSVIDKSNKMVYLFYRDTIYSSYYKGSRSYVYVLFDMIVCMLLFACVSLIFP